MSVGTLATVRLLGLHLIMFCDVFGYDSLLFNVYSNQ